MLINGHTDPTTVTLSAHARRGLMNALICALMCKTLGEIAHSHDIYIVTPPSVYNESIQEIAAIILAQPQRRLEKLTVLH